HRHGTGDRLVFLLLNLYLGLQWNIFFPEQLQRFFYAAQVDKVFFTIELVNIFAVYQFLVQVIAERGNFRLDLGGEILKALQQFPVGGVAGHPDIPQAKSSSKAASSSLRSR